jgi:hypothetical protein
MTQLERATVARKKLLDLFPQIVQAKDELQCVLDEAQNVPPAGGAAFVGCELHQETSCVALVLE